MDGPMPTEFNLAAVIKACTAAHRAGRLAVIVGSVRRRRGRPAGNGFESHRQPVGASRRIGAECSAAVLVSGRRRSRRRSDLAVGFRIVGRASRAFIWVRSRGNQHATPRRIRAGAGHRRGPVPGLGCRRPVRGKPRQRLRGRVSAVPADRGQLTGAELRRRFTMAQEYHQQGGARRSSPSFSSAN